MMGELQCPWCKKGVKVDGVPNPPKTTDCPHCKKPIYKKLYPIISLRPVVISATPMEYIENQTNWLCER